MNQPPQEPQIIAPFNLELEAALLGAILANNHAIERVVETLKPEHFYQPVHGEIYAACCALFERGETASPFTLKNYFDGSEALAEVNGGQYLFDLAASVVTVINAGDYGKSIHDLWVRRQQIVFAQDLIQRTQEPSWERSALDDLDWAETALAGLHPEGGGHGAADAKTFLDEAIDITVDAYKTKQDGGVIGVPSGIADLDEKIGGFHPGDLIIVAGRPSMGKTAFSKTVALNAALSGRHVLFMSSEMSRDLLGQTILSTLTGSPVDRMRSGHMTQPEIEKVALVKGDFPLFVDDRPAASAAYIRAVARRKHRRRSLDLVVVDYLQRLSVAEEDRGRNSSAQVGNIAKALKTLARDLDVPVILLSQLSRQVEQREDKRPQLSDLRDSGEIEQEADIVMFLYRERYYLERSEPVQRDREGDIDFDNRRYRWLSRLEASEGRTDLIIAKQRVGALGTVRMGFNPETTSFENDQPSETAEQMGAMI